jgi:hypothetical protein
MTLTEAQHPCEANRWGKTGEFLRLHVGELVPALQPGMELTWPSDTEWTRLGRVALIDRSAQTVTLQFAERYFEVDDDGVNWEVRDSFEGLMMRQRANGGEP